MATFRSGSWASRASIRNLPTSLPYDVLDATKIIPEEVLPVRKIGRLVLDRNPDNFFAETEQVAFCRPMSSRDRLHQRSVAARAVVQLSGHAEVTPGNRQLPSAADQRPEVPRDEFPAGWADADERAGGPGQLRAQQPGGSRRDGGPRECPMTGFHDSSGTCREGRGGRQAAGPRGAVCRPLQPGAYVLAFSDSPTSRRIARPHSCSSCRRWRWSKCRRAWSAICAMWMKSWRNGWPMGLAIDLPKKAKAARRAHRPGSAAMHCRSRRT